MITKGSHYDHQATRFANGRQPCRTSLLGSTQTGRIKNLQGSTSNLLRLVNRAELLNTFVLDRGHRTLSGMRSREIWFDLRQPVKESTFATALVAYQSNFHRFCDVFVGSCL